MTERRALRELRGLRDRAIESQGVVDGQLARREFRRLRVVRPDLAPVRVVDHDQRREQHEDREAGRRAAQDVGH